MDKMSLFTILLVSFPETFLNIFATFLLTGLRKFIPGRDNKKNRKENIFRYLICSFIIVTFSVLTRRFLNDIILITLTNIVLLLITFKLIYKISIFKAFIATAVYTLTLLSIEVLYLTVYAQFIELNFAKFYSQANDLHRVGLSLIERVYQISIILTFWDFQVSYENFNKYSKSKPLIITFLIFLIFLELSYSFVFFNAYSHLNIMLKIFGIIGNALGASLNFMFFKLYKNIIKEVKEKI